MNLEKLKELDSTFNVISGNPDQFNLIGISHSEAPRDNTFVFLKTNRFTRNIGRRLELKKFLLSGAIIEKKYFDTISTDVLDSLKDRFSWIATIDDVNRGMCSYSKPFYDQLHSDLNYQVDGRQFNTVSIDPSAEIAQNVFIGENVTIGKNTKILPGCVIMPEVKIGDGTILYPNITIYPYTTIGSNTRIHAGTVIGTDGFGYNFYDGKHNKIWHLCGVQIGNDVEIGCNTMIDSGAFIATRIDDGTRIDNDVQISHNVWVKEHVIICGKTGLAGSVEVNDYCAFGAGAGVAPAAILGKGVQVAARAVVSENANVEPGTVMAGHPARPIKEWMRSQAKLRQLAKK
jgi:UDP-3-O-[3-hydroxymyristoyl] glucosamine N-acyltransferase